MHRVIIALFVCVALTLFTESAVADGRRVALVVGNGAYQTVPALPNAVNDATAIAELFKAAKFDVITARTDLGNLAFKRTIREFEDLIVDSEIAVVYYAGHGIEVREQNYLIPTDAKLLNERDVEDEAIPLERVISSLEGAKRLRLVILDACRDNPFASKMKRRVASRGIAQGLAKVEPDQADTLIAYAAKDRAVANDGDGDHSPFTKALLENLTEPGLDVRIAFGRVRDAVLQATNRQQEPYLYGSLGGGTVALVPAAVRSGGADDGERDYQAVERLGTREAWQAFLSKHKSGLYADLARSQLVKMGDSGGAVISDASIIRGNSEPASPAVPPANKVKLPSVAVEPKPTRAEEIAWDKLEGSIDLRMIRGFVEKYPTSPLAALARRRIEILDRIGHEQEEALRAEREAARLRKEEEKRQRDAEAEQKRLEREAALLREQEARARAAEQKRQKAEQEAAARQREAEEKARAAIAAAEKRAEEERVRAAEAAVRRQEAEERARALLAERQKATEEAAARKREAEESAKVAAAAKAARDAEERERVRQAQEIERQDKARAAEIAAQEKQAQERAKAAEIAARKSETLEAARRRTDDRQVKSAESEQAHAKAAVETERRKAAEAAKAAVAERVKRAAAVQQREAAEEARQAAVEAAAARKKTAEIARRAAERAAERAEVASEKRRQATARAKEAARNREVPVRAGVRAPVRASYSSVQAAPARASAPASYGPAEIGAARAMTRMP